MKIVLVNVRYSPNLGDGVIAECLEDGLKTRLPGAQVIHCDLAGRKSYGGGRRSFRSFAMRVLPALPNALRSRLAGVGLEYLVRRRLLPHYAAQMDDADAVIFGGGQLLADADLNFPMKIAGAAAQARQQKTPIAIFAVGVGRRWSYEGANLFKEAFGGYELFLASVRDPLSAKRWRRHFAGAGITSPGQCVDPGLLAQKTYGDSARPEAGPGSRPTIGLCITNPKTLNAHSDQPEDGDPFAADHFLAIATSLIEKDFAVRIFTNGAPDDERIANDCYAGLVKKGYGEDRVSLAPQSLTPAELVRVITLCNAVVSHRLHTHIVAFSYQIPIIGLSLNMKLDQFFEMSGRSEFLLRETQFNPDVVAERVETALSSPQSPETYSALVARAESDLDNLVKALTVYKKTDPDEQKNDAAENDKDGNAQSAA
ncbi:MAG: polysaccharide pyruvyl transferase family protein [Pseudomonadota bacterium]